MEGWLPLALAFLAAAFTVSAMAQETRHRFVPFLGGRAAGVSDLVFKSHQKTIAEVIMKATCRNKMTIYFDGKKQTSTPLSDQIDWHTVGTFAVPLGAQEIGIECEADESSYGLAAWLSNGRMTDQTWHCSSESFEASMTAAEVRPINYSALLWEKRFLQKPVRARWIWATPENGAAKANRKAFCKASVQVPASFRELCPKDFTYDDGAEFCFKVVRPPFAVTWPQAAHMCRQLDLDVELASPDTKERMEALETTLAPGRYLVGLMKIKKLWYWTVTPQHLSANSPWWYPDQPNNLHGQYHGEFILEKPTSKKPGKVGLNDIQCVDRRSQFICEKRLHYYSASGRASQQLVNFR